jgi:hypothetical protein
VSVITACWRGVSAGGTFMASPYIQGQGNGEVPSRANCLKALATCWRSSRQVSALLASLATQLSLSALKGAPQPNCAAKPLLAHCKPLWCCSRGKMSRLKDTRAGTGNMPAWTNTSSINAAMVRTDRNSGP